MADATEEPPAAEGSGFSVCIESRYFCISEMTSIFSAPGLHFMAAEMSHSVTPRKRAASFCDEKKRHDASSSGGARKGGPDATHEIVVCHGNVIRYCFLRALQLPPEAWLRLSVYNASVTRVDIRANGECSVRFLGDIGFMPVRI